MSRAILGAALVALLALVGTVPAQAAGEAVTTTKSSFGLDEEIGIRWSGNTGEMYVWMEPAGAPLEGFAHGSYHSDYEESGTYELQNPGAGRWELHWTYLGADKTVYRGSSFAVKAPAAVKRVKSGHYGCYTTTTLGLTRSSIQFVKIMSASRYVAMGKSGKYRFSRKGAKLRFKTGPLRRHVARYDPYGDSKERLIFRRTENDRHGKPTIDVSDTYCSRGDD